MEGMPKKLETKTLTGRYDMKQLIKVQQVEQWFTTQLIDLYKVEDEDALPISFDLLEVIEKPTDKRLAFLKEKLTACPSEAESVIKELLAKLDELNIEL
ncbi:protein phosphatase 1 regulatory subunit 14b-like [Nannochloropsis oceanica]